MFRFKLIILFLYLTVEGLAGGVTSFIPVENYQRDSLSVSPEFDSLMNQQENIRVGGPDFRADTILLKRILKTDVPVLNKYISIVAVGDIMPGTNYPSNAYLPPSCSGLFDPVRAIISSADVAVGNLEGVFSSKGGVAKNCRDPKTCYVFRMPDSYAECIMDAGFDILGVANNHVNDFGYTGRINTARHLEESGIPFAGFPDHPYVLYSVSGFTVGFCAFAPHTGTLNLKDYSGAAKIVRDLKTMADIVIVSFHGGAEGRDYQHVADKDENFLGYNRGNVVKFAHTVVDAGADLVIGSGPHVVRAMEMYKGKLVAYSLGNFCTYRRFNLSGPNAYAPILEIRMDGDGNFIDGKIHSFIQLGEGGPVPDESRRAALRIKDLSKQDFPGGVIRIDTEGYISTDME